MPRTQQTYKTPAFDRALAVKWEQKMKARRDDPILTTREVMEKYKFSSEQAVRDWACRNRVPRRWGRYYESDVQRFRM